MAGLWGLGFEAGIGDFDIMLHLGEFHGECDHGGFLKSDGVGNAYAIDGFIVLEEDHGVF